MISTSDYIAKLNDIDWRLRHIEKLDIKIGTAVTVTRSGTPAANQVTYWAGPGTVAAAGSAYWDDTNGRMGFGTASPSASVQIVQAQTSNWALHVSRNLGSASTDSPVVFFQQGNSGDNQEVLSVRQVASSSHALSVLNNCGGGASGTYPLQRWLWNTGQAYELNLKTVLSSGLLRYSFSVINNSTTYADTLTLDRDTVGIGIMSPNATTLGIKAGTSSNDAAVGGVLFVSTSATGNVLTGEDDLMTYSVPANTLAANNQSLEFEAWGTYAANANNKTLKVYFGASSWTVINSNSSGISWYVGGRIVRTSSTAQKVFVTLITSSGVGTPLNVGTAAETLTSGTPVIKLTGTATATNDIVQEGFVVKWADANT